MKYASNIKRTNFIFMILRKKHGGLQGENVVK